jgi:hypothetical protein
MMAIKIGSPEAQKACIPSVARGLRLVRPRHVCHPALQIESCTVTNQRQPKMDPGGGSACHRAALPSKLGATLFLSEVSVRGSDIHRNDRSGCPGSTIAIWYDLQVDPIHDADDHSAAMLIDRGATSSLEPLTKPAKSRCSEN